MELDFTEKSGIYCFENLTNGNKYVGQSQQLNIRIKKHHRQLIKGCDDARVLQRAWNKYKEENFKVYIIEECDIELLDERETFWIRELNSHTSNGGYNISWGGSAIMRGLTHSMESRKKLSEARTGDKNPNFGKTLSDERKNRISIANKGTFRTEEQKANLANAVAGVKKNGTYSSKYVGVCYRKDRGTWIPMITFNKKKYQSACCKTEIEAALAYNEMALKFYGENAKLNIIIGG